MPRHLVAAERFVRNKMASRVPETETELLARAEALTGKSLGQIAGELNRTTPESLLRHKGWVGELIEQTLGATASNLPVPDFSHLGIELKTIPVNKNGRAGESTFVCAVSVSNNIGLSWENSTVKLKLARVLWVPVEATSDLELSERRIGRPFLWSPNVKQEEHLRNDWEELMDMIKMGEISKVDSSYGRILQIRPKAANASVLTEATSDSGEITRTLPRGFYLRPQFTNTLLNEYAC